MIKLFSKEPEAEIGPDGMTDYSRQLRKDWAERDSAMAKIEAAMDQCGINETLRNHLPYHYIIAALILGVKLESNQE